MAGDRDSSATTDPAATGEVEMYCAVCDSSYSADAKHCPRDGTRLVKIFEKKDSLIGRVLHDRFTVQSKLGAGGMGAVYRGLQHSVGREVAIKVIEPRLANHRDITKRFLREAQLSSRLSQPNTVTVLDFGQTEDGLLYLVMELLEGRSLEELLSGEGALPEDRVIRIGVQICDALDAAAGLHIVHRDLKPGNVVILRDPPGRDMTKVLDFGIAKSLAGDSGITTMTRSDMILGTPSYIAPEAVQGSEVDARADLYSLGVMLYEMVSGKLPFEATTVNTMLASHAAEPPRPLPETVSPALRRIIERMLEKDPARRFQSAAEARAALTAASRGHRSNTGALAATIPPMEPPPAGSPSPRRDAATPTPDSGPPAPGTMTPSPNAATAAPLGQPTPASPLPTGISTSEPPKKRWPWVTVAAIVGGSAVGIVATLGPSRDDSAVTAAPADDASSDAPNAGELAPDVLPSATSGSDSAATDAAPTAPDGADDTGAEKPAEPELIRFTRLDSRPRGARVTLKVEGQPDVVLCRSTPCLKDADVSAPKQPRWGTVVFTRKGYEDASFPVDLLADQWRRGPNLKPKKPGVRPSRDARKPPARKPPAKKPPTKPAASDEQPSDEEFLRRDEEFLRR